MKKNTIKPKPVKKFSFACVIRKIALAISLTLGILHGSHERVENLTLLKSPIAKANSINPIDLLRSGRRGRRQNRRRNQEGIVACYARFSSDQQDVKSISDQVRACRGHAAGKNLSISEGAIYQDEAVSGTVRDREGLNRLLADAAAGKIRVIYFYNLSRLARESVITKTVMRQLVDLYRVRVICVVENLDSDVHGWSTIAAIFSFIYEEFLNHLRENVRNGQIGTVLKGFSVGDWRFGYTSVPSPNGETIRRAGEEVPRRIYQIKEDEAGWVRQIFQWFVIEFRDIQWIVRELNRCHAPKDHRSTTSKWTHQLVRSLLRSPKYMGIWTWGETENVRDPETGKLTQVLRDEEECEDWIRLREDLRIIDDDLFVEAQERLDENARRLEEFRGDEGRLRGSNGSHRVQLLTGLMECPNCGSKFYVTGAHGDYLQCSDARDGVCDCKTMLPRRLAEQQILAVIGQRMLDDAAWRDFAYHQAVQAWHERRREQPDSIEILQQRIEQHERRIQRLLDQLEADDHPDPDIRQRLQERRRERSEDARQLEHLQVEDRQMPTPPPREWVAEQLQQLHEALHGNVAAANRALLQLVGESFALELISEEGRKRKFWRGRFRIETLAFPHLPVTFPADGGDEGDGVPPDIVLDFRKLPLEETQVQEAWRLLQDGLSFTEIAQPLGVHKTRVTAIMKIVARRFGNGLTAKELKQRFQRPKDKSHLYGPFIEPAIALYHQGMLIAEIAEQLKTNRKRIHLAVEAWHSERNLPVPDGRTRRQSLEYKGRSGWTNRPRSSGTDAA